MITALVFVGRNIHRLVKEYQIYSYNINTSISYKVSEDSFRIQKRFKEIINNNNYCKKNDNKCDEKMYKVREIFKNKYVIYKQK